MRYWDHQPLSLLKFFYWLAIFLNTGSCLNSTVPVLFLCHLSVRCFTFKSCTSMSQLGLQRLRVHHRNSETRSDPSFAHLPPKTPYKTQFLYSLLYKSRELGPPVQLYLLNLKVLLVINDLCDICQASFSHTRWQNS